MTNPTFFELNIIRPTNSKIINIEWLEAQTPTGNFLAGPNHNPIVSILKNRSKFIFKEKNKLKSEEFDIYGGIIIIKENKATLILDL